MKHLISSMVLFSALALIPLPLEAAGKDRGKPAPDLVAVDLEGNLFNLSEVLGENSFVPPESRKALMLIMFTIPCKACVDEIPDIKKLRKEYAGKPVQFLYMNVGNSQDDASAWARTHKLDFQMLLDEEWFNFELLREAYQFRRAFPVSLIFDRDGYLAAAPLIGVTPMDHVRKSLNAALGSKAPERKKGK